MTASLARMEKGMADVGRCLLPTTIPLRQPRRISIHPGLVCMPGSQSVLETPVAASLDAAFLPDREPCGGVRHPTGGRCRIFIPLDRESANYTGQHLTESFGSVAPSIFGFAHVHNMRESNAESVASAYANARS